MAVREPWFHTSRMSFCEEWYILECAGFCTSSNLTPCCMISDFSSSFSFLGCRVVEHVIHSQHDHLCPVPWTLTFLSLTHYLQNSRHPSSFEISVMLKVISLNSLIVCWPLKCFSSFYDRWSTEHAGGRALTLADRHAAFLVLWTVVTPL